MPLNQSLKLRQLMWVAITLPPIQAAHEFFDFEPEFGHRQRTLGRSVAADAAAIRDDGEILVDRCGGFFRHLTVGDVDSAWYVFRRERLG